MNTDSTSLFNPALFIRGVGVLLIGCLLLTGTPSAGSAQTVEEQPGNTPALSLGDAVQEALEANLQLMISQDEIDAAENNRKVQRSNFLPTLNATYQYNRNDEEGRLGGFVGGITTSLLNEYSLVASFRQSVFEGFALINRYKVAELGLEVAQINEELTRQQIIFLAKNAYFSTLKAQKLVDVAKESVDVIEAQEEVAQNFYNVGMTPLNDLLEVQVRLANARQDLIVSQNNLRLAESQFNVVLRRPITAPVVIADVAVYVPVDKGIDYYIDYAEANRLEIEVAELEVQIADKEVRLAKKTFYPSVSVEGQWFRRSTEWDLRDDSDILDPDGWSITGIASWDFWDWGRTYYGSQERYQRLSQARHNLEDIQDQIALEVKEAYLKAVESQNNIKAVEKAIEQAKENLRINEERYKEQVATSTQVLDAQLLLSVTMSNYYNALYDFKIAEAALEKALSLEVIE